MSDLSTCWHLNLLRPVKTVTFSGRDFLRESFLKASVWADVYVHVLTHHRKSIADVTSREEVWEELLSSSAVAVVCLFHRVYVIGIYMCTNWNTSGSFMIISKMSFTYFMWSKISPLLWIWMLYPCTYLHRHSGERSLGMCWEVGVKELIVQRQSDVRIKKSYCGKLIECVFSPNDFLLY